MTINKQKSFSTVQEIFKTYFPVSTKREEESKVDDYTHVTDNLASELAKKLQNNLQHRP